MTLASEIAEIPERAIECQAALNNLTLPNTVPYLGMGSSYFAALTLKYASARIGTDPASEYDAYLTNEPWREAVLISQSGNSSETVWCLDGFDTVDVIVNDLDSQLARSPKARQIVDIRAGREEHSSTKSYVNTLVALYEGLGFDTSDIVENLKVERSAYEDAAAQIALQITGRIKENSYCGMYVLGSGPNLGTAYQTALVLSETTKLPWIAMSVAQFDHGPKEAADQALVIALDPNWKDAKRIAALQKTLNEKSKSCEFVRINGAHVETAGTRLSDSTPPTKKYLSKTTIDPRLSPIPMFMTCAHLMGKLADQIGFGDPFVVGGKVTTVAEDLR